MTFALRALVAALLAGAALAPVSQAAAMADLELGVGADWRLEKEAIFDLTFGARAHLARRLSLGGRVGAIFRSPGPTLGIPLDLDLRVTFSRFYLEGLGGPWILIDDALRAHAALGFGLRAGDFNVGLEVGWLDPKAMIGLRVAFAL